MMHDLLDRLEKQVTGPHWAGTLALVISVALLVCSPVFFYMLLGAANRDETAAATVLENRIIQCDNNAMLRRQLGVTDSLQICVGPHPAPHK